MGGVGKGVSTKAWANSLLKAYQRGSNLGCAFTSGSDSLHDFINAASKYAPQWSALEINTLQHTERQGREVQSIEDYVTDFKTHFREVKAYGKRGMALWVAGEVEEAEDAPAGPTFKGKGPATTPQQPSASSAYGPG